MDDFGVFLVGKLILYFSGIRLEVVEFPFFDVVVIHELVAAIVDTFVPMNHVPAWVFVVMVVVRGTPVFGLVTFEERHEAQALHVGGLRNSSNVEEGLGEIEVGNQVLVHRSGASHSWPTYQQGCTVGFIKHESLVEPTVLTEIKALVTGVDEDSVLCQTFAFEMLLESSHTVIDRPNATEVILYVSLVLPTDELLTFQLCGKEGFVLGLGSIPLLLLFFRKAI